MTETRPVRSSAPAAVEPAASGFDELCEAHVAMLTGSLVSGIASGPDAARYVWSDAIPDPTLNFACGVRSAEQRDWAVEAAHSRGRDPAFLARDPAETAALRGLIDPEAVFPASWMVAETEAAPPVASAVDGVVAVERHAGAAPPESFCEVFAGLSDDPRVCAHVERYYVSSLREARARKDVESLHLVVHDEAGPAACASLYLRENLAGLYNVSTRADRQRRGLGAAVTACAMAEARERAAARVFLQCPAGGFVEQLYARAGFRTVCSPSLVCLHAP